MLPRKKDDRVVRALVPAKVRVIVQARGRGKHQNYSPVPGHAAVVEVRNLIEFRKLWAAIEAVCERGDWRDGA